MLQPAGPAAQAIADIGWVLIAVLGLAFAATMGLLWFALRRGGAAASSPRPRHWLVGGGIVFPAVVLVGLLAYSQWRGTELRADPPPGAMVVGVTGHMWWWEVRYRDPASGAEIVSANEIVVPTGRPVHLGLSSADVIHSVWFPALAGKMDTVPGRVNRLVFSVEQPGVHTGQCAEFCGEQHARMGLRLVALPPTEFDAWLRAQAAPAREPPSPLHQRGREVFLAQRCNACHTVRGVAEEGRLGPDLTHVGSRVALAAGTLGNGPQELAHWIAHTQQIKPGARMPSYERLDAASLQALAAFLAGLR